MRSTNEVNEFISSIKDVSEDVALELLLQYFEYNKVNNEKEIIDRIILTQQQNANECFMFYQEILNDISTCLKVENLTLEERLKLIDKEIEVMILVRQLEADIRENNYQLINKK